MPTTDPNPPVVEKDTEAVTGNTGAAPSGTASTVSNKDTSGVIGGSRTTEPVSPAVTQVDTEGAVGGSTTSSHASASESPQYSGTIETRGAGFPPQVSQAYRAPSLPPAASNLDTTRTDTPVSDGTNPTSQSNFMTGTIETGSIGATAATSTNVTAAPTSVTATAGPRGVTVGWTAPTAVSGVPTTGFQIEGSTGGTLFAPKNATSIFIGDLVPGQAYTFRVAARNKNGLSPFSTASSEATPYNPDEADANKPAGIDAANRTNPVYLPDGTVKPGTGGTPSKAINVNLTPGNTQLVVAWTAPTYGGTISGASVKVYNGSGTLVTTGTVSGAGTSKTITGLANGTAYTVTVTLSNSKGTGETTDASAPSTPRTVPGAPTIGTAVGGAGQATVAWTAPGSTGGSAITGYTITASTGPTTTAAAGATSKVFTGLTPGNAVTFTVHATNVAGNSAESAASNSVTPS